MLTCPKLSRTPSFARMRYDATRSSINAGSIAPPLTGVEVSTLSNEPVWQAAHMVRLLRRRNVVNRGVAIARADRSGRRLSSLDICSSHVAASNNGRDESLLGWADCGFRDRAPLLDPRSRQNALNCSGVIGSGSMASCASLPATSGEAMALMISLLRLCTIGAGSLAGPENAHHVVVVRSSWPISLNVGTCS